MEPSGQIEASLSEVVSAPVVTPPVAARSMIDGEVRTVDSNGQPRLWGRGRPAASIYGEDGESGACTVGDLRYGLSATAVDWGSAADACPAGTWVCREGELTAGGTTAVCDTDRTDGALDGLDCDGTGLDWAASDHRGWVAGTNGTGSGELGRARRETSSGDGPSSASFDDTCASLPVWCCWSS